jgi:hypothetical protein
MLKRSKQVPIRPAYLRNTSFTPEKSDKYRENNVILSLHNVVVCLCAVVIFTCLVYVFSKGSRASAAYGPGKHNSTWRATVRIGRSPGSRLDASSTASSQQQQQKQQQQQQQKAAAVSSRAYASSLNSVSMFQQPVVKHELMVGIANHHWWTDTWGHDWVEKCDQQDLKLSCRFVNLEWDYKDLTDDAKKDLASKADAFLYHICPNEPLPIGARPGAPVVVASQESATNYPCINDAKLMAKADFEMSYRSCAQVSHGIVSCGARCHAPCCCPVVTGKHNGGTPMEADICSRQWQTAAAAAAAAAALWWTIGCGW